MLDSLVFEKYYNRWGFNLYHEGYINLYLIKITMMKIIIIVRDSHSRKEAKKRGEVDLMGAMVERVQPVPRRLDAFVFIKYNIKIF